MRFSIGHVSKIFEISTDTLRYYDKMGLLKPEINENNGYRFYEGRHLEKLGFIIGAKYLGIPLGEIKETIESGDIITYQQMLVRQEQLIQEKIKQLRKLAYQVRVGKELTEKVMGFQNEYDFSKLPIFEEDMLVYGFDNRETILNTDFYRRYMELFEKENQTVENEPTLYIYRIHENQTLEECEDVIYIRANPFTSQIFADIGAENQKQVIQKKIQGRLVHAGFYGTAEEMSAYILSLNQYFACNPNHEVYVFYEFYLPKNDRNTCYFVEIQLRV